MTHTHDSRKVVEPEREETQATDQSWVMATASHESGLYEDPTCKENHESFLSPNRNTRVTGRERVDVLERGDTPAVRPQVL